MNSFMRRKMNALKSSTFGLVIFLAWPTVVEQMLQTIVQYVDTAMVGRLGTQATSTVGVTATVTWLVNSPAQAIGVGFVAFIAKAIGAGEKERAKRAAGQAVTSAVLLGAVLGAVTLALSNSLPRLLNADRELWEGAGRYFFIICLPMIFRSLMSLCGSVLRASRDTRTPMIVNLLMNLLNIILNILLIYETNDYMILGHTLHIWGAGLGVNGAAIASAISFTAGGIGMLIALYCNREISPKSYGFGGLGLTKDIMQPCCKVALPVLLERVFTCFGYVVFAALVNGLGTLALAAHTIAITAEEIFYIPGYGMQAAASTLAGNAYGEGESDKIRRVTKTMCLMIFMIMAVSGALLFVFARPMMGLFIKGEEAIAIGAVVLRMVAVSEPLYGVSIILDGIFQGVGDTKHPFIFSAFSMWGIRILFTWIGVTFFSQGLYYVWGCMIANNVVKAFLLIFHYYFGKWNPLEN